MPENAKLERVLMGLFCSEISAMSLRPLKAKALIFVMLLESKLSFFKCLNLEKAGGKKLENFIKKKLFKFLLTVRFYRPNILVRNGYFFGFHRKIMGNLFQFTNCT